jgi:Rad3-related DNA helicase
MGAYAPQGKDDRKLHEVLNGMYGMLDSILKVILSPEEIYRKDNAIGSYFPVYSLLDWALTVEGSPPAYEAILRVASEADRIRWEADQIEGVFYDTPKKLGEDELLRFVENWKPPNLLKENRRPYNDGLMGGHMLQLYSDNKSTRLLLQVLRLVLQHTEAEGETTNQVEYALREIKKQLRSMRRDMFDILRRLYYIKDAKDISDHPSRYNRRHEELRSRCQKLVACLEEVRAQFMIVSKNDLSQILRGTSYSKHLHLVYEEGINRASKQARKLRRSLLCIVKQLPKPGKFCSDQATNRTIEPLFRELGKLNLEYFTSTIPIQDEYLDSGFELLYSDKRFNKRTEQRQYARFISEAIKLGGVYAAEAGTGTGKTLGYLIPACEHLRINKRRHVVVATATINLMDQIVNKDWRTLASLKGSIYRDLQIVTLKGKRNYLCITELNKLFIDLDADTKKDDEARRVDVPFVAEDRLAWLYLFQILTRKNGQWDSSTEFNRKYPRIAKEYSVDAETACKPGTCRMGAYCIYPQAVRRAQHAHVVITNHHKLVNLNDEIKERASVCIIDEVDQFPDSLRSALSKSISKNKIRDYIYRLSGTKKRRGFVQVLREELKKEWAEDLLFSLREIEESCPRIYDCLLNTTYGSENEHEKRWKDLKLSEQRAIETMLGDLEKYLGIVEEQFRKILESDWYRQKQNMAQKISLEKDRIKKYDYETNELLSVVKALLAAIQDQKFIVSYEQRGFDWSLKKIPFEIGDQAHGLVNSFETSILTSATLYVDKNTDLFVLELFDDPDSAPQFTAETQISSPFPYEKQASGAVSQFIPAYKYSNPNEEQREWERQAMETIALLSVALDGRTLVLFRNWKEMQRTYERIRPVLEKYDIPVLLQDKAGGSEAIIEEFGGLEESVLLGTGRFWTGVDFPGPTLSQLIITRIPNEALGRPLVRERKERWSEDKFWDLWYAQNTRRTLSQGFGRLIRKSDDKGLFIILDSRIASDKRMIAHQKAVPVKLNSEFNSVLKLADWGIKKLELSPEIKGRGIMLERVHQEIKRSVNWHPQHR